MEVNPTSAGVYGARESYTAGGNSEIDDVDFMQLLITQMRHQDPFEPMDNSQMVSQLNQFALLDEVGALNSKTDDMLLMSQSLNNTMMLDLVGRTVQVEGDQVVFTPATAVNAAGDEIQAPPRGSEFHFVADQGGTARITLRDAGGEVVGTYTLAVAGGLNELKWQDLLTDPGGWNLDGRYTVEVSVTNANGSAVSTLNLMTLPVDSIRYENNIGVVEVGGRDFLVSQIYQVSI